MTCDSVRHCLHYHSINPDIVSYLRKPRLMEYEFLEQKRPCTRCIKRNISHLCHDEPRDTVKRTKNEQEVSAVDEEGSSSNDLSNAQKMSQNIEPQEVISDQLLQDSGIQLPQSSVNPSQPVQSQPVDVNPQQRKYRDNINKVK